LNNPSRHREGRNSEEKKDTQMAMAAIRTRHHPRRCFVKKIIDTLLERVAAQESIACT
jgi:hypothetical protein